MNFRSLIATAALVMASGSALAQEMSTEAQQPEGQIEVLASDNINDELSYGMTDDEFTVMSSRSASGERFARRVVGEIIDRITDGRDHHDRGGFDGRFDDRRGERDHRGRDDRGWGRREQVVCYAQNRRGEIFRARGNDRRFVQERAMDKCEDASRRCRPLGCERR